MKHSQVLLGLSANCIVPISSLSVPPPTQLKHNNATLSNLLLPPSYPLTRPPNIPDLETTLTFDTTKPLSPIGILCEFIAMMYIFSTHSWTEDLLDPIRVDLPNQSVEISLSVSLRTQIKYLVVALYTAGTATAQGNQFYTLDVAVAVDGIRTASIFVRRKARRGDEIVVNKTVNASDTFPELAAAANNSSLATDPRSRGSFTDPTDPKMVISYEYDGTRISSGAIFTACLDALAEVPQHGQQDVGVVIEAKSVSGDCTISLRGVRLMWEAVAKVILYLYVNIMVTQRRFGGMRLSVIYEGVEVGEGVVAKVQGVVS